MGFSKNSAIARYKAAARKIRHDRKRGVTPSKPAAPPVAPLIILQAVTGEWFATRALRRVAGPFDSREEAEQWITANIG